MKEYIDKELLKPIRRKPSLIERWKTCWDDIFECCFVPFACLLAVTGFVIVLAVLVALASRHLN